VNNPYLMAVLFGQVLILTTCFIGSYNKFIAFILFMVYLGGIIILIRYCVILIPTRKFTSVPITPFLFGVAVYGGFSIPIGSIAYGLVYRVRAIFLIALLLYLVILSIVQIIDYSRGIMKF